MPPSTSHVTTPIIGVLMSATWMLTNIKRNTQKIERKNLNLRTWINRLERKTICFSKSELMHNAVIGLLINKVEFGLDIHAKIQV